MERDFFKVTEKYGHRFGSQVHAALLGWRRSDMEGPQSKTKQTYVAEAHCLTVKLYSNLSKQVARDAAHEETGD